MARTLYSDPSEDEVRAVELLIIDDIVPSTFSPFRTLEYAHYLSSFDCAVLSLEGWHLWIENIGFDELAARFPVTPEGRRRLLTFRNHSHIGARLAYVTFLGNARRLMPYFRARRLPFILQLYPGGSFEINQPHVDDVLREVLLSELCRGVIVTNPVTQAYIVDRIGCDAGKVTSIYGGVFDSNVQFDFSTDKHRYPAHKDTLDVCFVAHKYGGDVTSKGYDQFVAIAQRLAAEIPHLRFHVVGDYTAADLPLGEAAQRFTFYGRRESAFFASFYPRMDAIVSINRPFVLGPGAFDGFPTGCCIEAGFHGVLNCINDPLEANRVFTDEEDLILLDGDTERSIAVLRALLADPPRVYAIAYANWRKFLDVFDVDAQLRARTRVIAAELSRAPLYYPTALRASGLEAAPFMPDPHERSLTGVPGPRPDGMHLRVPRAVKLVWWTITLQLPRRVREWRQIRSLRTSPAAPIPSQ
jgi:glycosyltransferase involved in cell wall biosynthesis